MNAIKVKKIGTPRLSTLTVLKIEQFGFQQTRQKDAGETTPDLGLHCLLRYNLSAVMCLKDADGVANNVDIDQIAQLGAV